jgi:pimeloyl-ACP methyl ester carboxylesterase
MTTTPATDVIVLIPGFLGFDKLGDNSYFEATVGKTIVSELRAQGHSESSLKVVPVSTLPSDTLLQRQNKLLAELRAIAEQNPNVRLHLVGHSTGGLDAELLCHVRDLEERAWSADNLAVRRKIHSITCVASPLSGTTLADSPLATFFGLRSPADALTALKSAAFVGLPGVFAPLLRGVLGLRKDRAFVDIARGVLDDFPKLATYVTSVFIHRGLISDLRPKNLKVRMARAQSDPELAGVRHARFLTIAPAPDKKKPSAAGELFATLYRSTADAADSDAAPSFTAELQKRFRERRGIQAIAKDPERLAQLVNAIDPKANDGIVNTLRQLSFFDPALVASELDRVRAIVLADHLDVVGYYPNNNIAPPTPLKFLRPDGSKQNGFLESGASFRDDQLKALYRLVAQEIAQSVAAPPDTVPPPPIASASV